MECKYCKLIKNLDDVVLETKHWKAKLSDEQSYLGRCVVFSKRHTADLSELNQAEWEDLRNMVIKLEGGIRVSLGARMFNWACLMNNAYQERSPVPHVHWHVRPRYDKKVKIGGVLFEDREFGHNYDRRRHRVISKEIREVVVKKIISGIRR
ncbi:MAG: HIT family protein [Candidatus Micrarchaeota archaeon]|nr:HIT family protein [Candidatus Micrarchaeota archaeon]